MPPKRRREAETAATRRVRARRAAAAAAATVVNATNPLLIFPGEIRNRIYQALFDQFVLTHRPYMITRRGVDPHGPPTAQIRNSPCPLVMSAPNGFNVIPWADTDPLRRVNAATQAAIHDGYCAMKTDLLAAGQISRQFMREYRSFQRARLQPFVALDEFWNFVKIFYPSEDPAIAFDYQGPRITLALPRHSYQMYDIMPVLRFFNRASSLQCNIWGAYKEDGDWYKVLAQPLRQYVFAPREGALTISKLMFRPYGRRRVYEGNLDNYHDLWYSAAFRVVFDPVSRRDWMDGKLISFPAQPQRALTRMNKERARRQDILQFLKAAGLNNEEIMARWEMRFTVLE